VSRNNRIAPESSGDLSQSMWAEAFNDQGTLSFLQGMNPDATEDLRGKCCTPETPINLFTTPTRLLGPVLQLPFKLSLTTNSVVILFLTLVQVILVPFTGVLSRPSFPVLPAFISFWSLICTSSWGPGLTGYRPKSIVDIWGKTVNADLCLRRLVLQHSLAVFERDEQREAHD
jgi:hypothetical protein